jgi:excisionase family DNA binding protein
MIHLRIISKCGKNKIMEDKKLLTTQETAQLLGISDGRVRRMILDGIIKAEKFGRSNMIKKSDAEKVKIYGKVGRPKKETAKE